MVNQTQLDTLRTTYLEAKASGHVWPDFAACEVMVESAWGASGLYLHANNGFGEKQHHPPIFETYPVPTKEYLKGLWVIVQAEFIKFPTLADCFTSRMNTLRRLAPVYPNYAAALAATTGEDFVTEVSKTWSTGPTRAQQVIEIRHSHPEAFE